MTESNSSLMAETDFGYGQLFAILIRRRFWLISVFLTVIAVTIFVTLRAKPTYESSMQLLIEPNVYKGEEGSSGGEFADSNVEIDSGTQLNLMQSTGLIQRAVILLKNDYPEITIADIKKSLILSHLADETKKDAFTKIFQVVYTDNDPLKTQRVLEALQKVYLAYNLEQQRLRLDKGLEFITGQLPAVYEKGVKAQARLENFRTEQGVIDPGAKAEALTKMLDEIKQQRLETRTQYQDALASYEVLQGQLARSPKEALTESRLSQSTRYQTLLNQIQETESALALQRLKYTRSHPTIQNLAEQRREQLGLLKQEMDRVLGSAANQANMQGENLLAKGQLGEIDLKITERLAEVQSSMESLRVQEASLAKFEQRLESELSQYPKLMAEYDRLQPEVTTQSKTLEKLLQAQQDLGLAISRGAVSWQIVEAPQLGHKTGPNKIQNLMLGSVVGLFLGGIASFGREMLDDAVHTSNDLKKQVSLPLLGMLPKLTHAKAGKLITNFNLSLHEGLAEDLTTIELLQWQPFREALDLIYKNIQLITAKSQLKSLLITSSLPGEGKTTLSLGLAMSAARLHRRVLLIDADLRRPSLHQLFNLPNEQGLSTLISDHSTIPTINHIPPSDSDIDILTAGPIPLDPVKLLSAPKMRELLTAFEQNYDLVIVDATPVLGIVDAIQVGSCCQGVLMVGRIGQVTRRELTEAIAMLDSLNVVGIVANGAESTSYGYAIYDKN